MEIQKKSFWSKPEGITGIITLLLGAGAIFYFWGTIVPFVLMVLQNTLYSVITGVILFAIIYVILDPKFRNLIWYLYKFAMRKITGLFIQLDPIAIIKIYIQNLKDKREEMNEQIVKLMAEKGKLKKAIETNQETIDKNINLANTAEKLNKINEKILYAREAARMSESNKRLTPLLERMEKMYTFLNKMYENSLFVIKDMESDVFVREKEYNAIKASHNALRSALSIINGDGDKKIMFDEAMEFLQEDIGRKVGEMDRFMQLSQSFMTNIDIQNGAYDEEALKLLDNFNENDFTFLLDSPKSTSVTFNNNLTPEPIVVSKKSSKFENLLN